eukprot:893504-Amphidinium_carterae.1
MIVGSPGKRSEPEPFCHPSRLPGEDNAGVLTKMAQIIEMVPNSLILHADSTGGENAGQEAELALAAEESKVAFIRSANKVEMDCQLIAYCQG